VCVTYTAHSPLDVWAQTADNGVMHILEDMLWAPVMYEKCVSLSPALPQRYELHEHCCVRLA